MKKLKTLIIVVVVIFILMSCVAGIGGSDTSSTKEDQKEAATSKEVVDEVEENGTVATSEEVSNSDESKSGYIQVGDTYTNEIGVSLTILDIGYSISPTQTVANDLYEQDFLFVVAEMDNQSDEQYAVNQTDTRVYIDGYQYSSIWLTPIDIGDMTSNLGILLEPGRKCKFIFYTSIDESLKDVYTAEKVEFEIYDLLVLFKDNGEWITRNSGSNSNVSNEITTNSTGIGNPVIDADPDKYIPEGITGKIDVIDGTFYSNKPVRGIIPGEYLAVYRGSTGIINISDDYKFSLGFISSEVDFEESDMEELINCADGCSYHVYDDDNGNGYVVSFYEGGLYLYTGHVDDENDWAEGFYELLN